MTKRIRSFFLVSLIISASLSLSGCFLIGNKIIALDQDVE